MTKLIFDKDTHRVLGGAIVGSNGGELLGEIGLAIEMGCDLEDIALHYPRSPNFTRVCWFSYLLKVFREATITDLPNDKSRRKNNSY